MMVRLGPGVAFAQIGVVGFDEQIELEALRLFGLPEHGPAVLCGTPALPVGQWEFQAETSLDLPNLGPGATHLVDVTVAGARQGDRSARHGAYARGDARMQDLSDPAVAVLPNRVPDSGTAERLLTAGGALGGYFSPEALAGGAGLMAAYSRPGARAITGLLAGRRPAAVGLLGDTVARAGPVTVPLGLLSLEPPQNDLPFQPNLDPQDLEQQFRTQSRLRMPAR